MKEARVICFWKKAVTMPFLSCKRSNSLLSLPDYKLFAFACMLRTEIYLGRNVYYPHFIWSLSYKAICCFIIKMIANRHPLWRDRKTSPPCRIRSSPAYDGSHRRHHFQKAFLFLPLPIFSSLPNERWSFRQIDTCKNGLK